MYHWGYLASERSPRFPIALGRLWGKVPGVVLTNSPLKDEGKIPLKDFGECPGKVGFGEALGKVPGVVFTNSPLKEDGKKQLKVFGECPG